MIETRTQGCDCSQVKPSSKSLKISHDALLGGAMVPSCPQIYRVQGSGIETWRIRHLSSSRRSLESEKAKPADYEVRSEVVTDMLRWVS